MYLLCTSKQDLLELTTLWYHWYPKMIKFMLSKKATKTEEIFTVDLTVCSKCQIDGEDFVKFCGLLRKHKLYSTTEVMC